MVQESSILALQASDGGRVLAVGDQAWHYLGRTHKGIRLVRPIQGGVVADLAIAELLLKALLHGPLQGRRRGARMAIAIALEASDVERQALLRLVRELGYTRLYSMPSPLAAALGAGLPVHEPEASMVLDLGSGCCEAAIISMGAMVVSRTMRMGGDDLDAALQQQFRSTRHLHAGLDACEELRRELGSLDSLEDARTGQLKGVDTRRGLPCALEIQASMLRPTLQRYADAVADMARSVLERCPPELAGDLLGRGIVLCGGVALQRGLAAFLQRTLRLPVRIDADPMTTVARGLGLLHT
ncbi:rod shape-determining protein [Megalodesulfovibrio paquesii]